MEMNVQLHHVVSDITGVTGMRIIRAIVAGERDPVTLAETRLENQGPFKAINKNRAILAQFLAADSLAHQAQNLASI